MMNKYKTIIKMLIIQSNMCLSNVIKKKMNVESLKSYQNEYSS